MEQKKSKSEIKNQASDPAELAAIFVVGICSIIIEFVISLCRKEKRKRRSKRKSKK